MRYRKGQEDYEAIYVEYDGRNIREVVEWSEKKDIKDFNGTDLMVRGTWCVLDSSGRIEHWDPEDFAKQFDPLERVVCCEKHRVTLYNKQRKIEHKACPHRVLWVVF